MNATCRLSLTSTERTSQRASDCCRLHLASACNATRLPHDDSFYFVESNLIVGAVVELRCPRALMGSNRSCAFECATGTKVTGDAGCAERVTTNLGAEIVSTCAPLHHAENVV